MEIKLELSIDTINHLSKYQRKESELLVREMVYSQSRNIIDSLLKNDELEYTHELVGEKYMLIIRTITNKIN